jgi:uncharacterized OB-fold protein
VQITDVSIPVLDGRSEEWFTAAAEGRLLIQRCRRCGHAQFYPRRLCTACHSLDVDWEQAAGTGRLHTFTVVHRTPNAEFAGETPYVFAIVELDEGPRVTSRVVGVNLDALVCDMRVRAEFPDGEPRLPVFVAAGEA